MEKDDNLIKFELNIRLQMKDYRAILGVKRTWVVAIVAGLAQAAIWLYKHH